jgi:hypothetical protein
VTDGGSETEQVGGHIGREEEDGILCELSWMCWLYLSPV